MKKYVNIFQGSKVNQAQKQAFLLIRTYFLQKSYNILKMLQKYPEYEQDVKIPEKVWTLRIWYMYKQEVCTLIDVNEQEQKVKIKN